MLANWSSFTGQKKIHCHWPWWDSEEWRLIRYETVWNTDSGQLASCAPKI